MDELSRLAHLLAYLLQLCLLSTLPLAADALAVLYLTWLVSFYCFE
jgi:hypothetical protein